MHKILIVDDEEIMRDMLVQMVTEVGYTASSAINGLEAESACDKEHFDLVILDMVMPGQDGLATVAKLRQNHGYLKIIAISGGDRSFDGTTYLDLVKDHGAHKTFVKPFERDEILMAIGELLKTP
jgi:two-component system phosphate regulon response regulator OmpR